MNLYEKLIEVRKSVDYLPKKNQGKQYKYVSSSQCLGAVRDKMNEIGVLLVPSVKNQTIENLETKTGGREHLTKLEMEFTWVNAEKPEEKMTVPWQAQGIDARELGIGKALTYAEKYFLLKSFNIPTDNLDPDTFQEEIEEQKAASQTAASSKEPAAQTQTQPQPQTNDLPLRNALVAEIKGDMVKLKWDSKMLAGQAKANNLNVENPATATIEDLKKCADFLKALVAQIQ